VGDTSTAVPEKYKQNINVLSGSSLAELVGGSALKMLNFSLFFQYFSGNNKIYELTYHQSSFYPPVALN
jgi:hypothetical protein